MASKKSGIIETQYNRDEFIQNAQALFQVKPEIVAGAIHQVEKDQLTIDEAKRLVDQFLKRKVL
ncbi:hypothetical protein [Cohnella mopanensis]|uniref:hypothetical protein n=1 Tax=Cohnella mopanensis TaxID=2911966 RepID=UPI001EF8FEC1|nr:hypothetical protein [Cohnella mopanensis]